MLSIASFMLANTTRLIIGSSIANIYARDPFSPDTDGTRQKRTFPN